MTESLRWEALAKELGPTLKRVEVVGRHLKAPPGWVRLPDRPQVKK